MSKLIDANEVKAIAQQMGFHTCGLAIAAPVEAAVANHYMTWIAQGGHGEMDYLARNIEKRLDPTLLLPGAKTIVSVALNYYPQQRLPSEGYQLASYAYGKDYHDLMKHKLRRMAEAMSLNTEETEIKVCCDTAPVLERYWAAKAGLGWIGRNLQLIIPGAGSHFFLGELILTSPANHYDQPMPQRCGNCHACEDACEVLREKRGMVKCLSYQTIEYRGPLSPDIIARMGNNIYGCDRCLEVCPWNRFALPTEEPDFQPSSELLSMSKADWHQLSVEQYRRLFKGSAVKRTKYEGLMRNINSHRLLPHDNGDNAISPEP